jgi:hypothetical protein
MGGVRRLARESLVRPSYVPLSNVQLPVMTENWTTQETTTYNALLPADSPGVWGGTKANLDRILTATGSTYTVRGALLTFVTKPDVVAGPIIKVQVSYAAGSACAIEVWTKAGATWTKRRRVAVAGVVRSGETIVLDLSGFLVLAANCDAIWVTLVPDIGTETLTWTCLHLYGICNDDPVTSDCPAGTPPEDCDEPGCLINIDTGVCEDDTGTPDPFIFPPEQIVKIPNPTTFVKSGNGYIHACPRPTKIVMTFGDIPGGGSVVVTPVPTSNVTFAEGASQTISAPGDLTWTVLTGYAVQNQIALPALYPAPLIPTTDFLFVRQLAGIENLVALGNLLDILMYWWTADIGYQEVC